MSTYIITYDLKNTRNYNELYEYIKSYGSWAHINESTWAIVADQSASEIRDQLKNHLETDDLIFVIRSGTEAAWTNVLCSDKWLKKNL